MQRMAVTCVLLASLSFVAYSEAIATSVSVTTPTPVKSVCPHRWLTRPGSTSCYRLWPESSKSWDNARATCQRYDADLLILNSVEEQEWIMQEIIKYSVDNEWWIGLKRNETDDQSWLWLDGSERNESNSYLPWGSNEPNNFRGEEDCAEIWDNLLNDKNCAQLLQFICERPNNIPLLCDVDNGWDSHGGQNCYKFFDESLTMREARIRCYEDDAELLRIDGEKEQEIVTDYIKHENKASIWLKMSFQPIRDTNTDEQYQWSWDSTGSSSTQKAQWWNTEPPDKDTLMYNKTLCSVMNTNTTDYKNWFVSNCEEKNKLMCMRSTGKCPEGFHKNAGTCYLLHVSEAMNWNEARGHCNLRGTKMLEITSEARQDFVNSVLKTSDNQEDVWLALSGSSPDWTWDSATPLESYEQQKLQGINGSGCISIRANGDSQWYKANCSKAKAVMCTVPENHPVISVEPYTNSTMICPDDYDGPAGELCYKAVYDELDWLSARNACRAEGTDLAFIPSIRALDVLTDKIQGDVWIGLNDRAKEGDYVWLDSTEKPFRAWKLIAQNINVEIGGKYSENCVAMRYLPGKQTNGMWMDMPCTFRRGFLCGIKGEKNIALGKLARLSSENSDAKLAIDGCSVDCTCAVSQQSDKPWLRLDLGTIYPIRKIVIHAGTNVVCSMFAPNCGLKDFKIYITNSSTIEMEISDIVYEQAKIPNPTGVFTIMLPNVTYGRYVQVEAQEDYFILSVCELQVFEASEISAGAVEDKFTSQSNDNVCEPGWVEDSTSGRCYFKVEQTLTWADAEDECKFMQGTLATPAEKLDVQFLKGIFTNDLSGAYKIEFWIGAWVNSGLTQWQTLTASEALVQKMSTVVPRVSDSSKTLCGIIQLNDQMLNGKLTASSCLERKPFVCQYFSKYVKFKTSGSAVKKSLQTSDSKVLFDDSSVQFEIKGTTGATLKLLTKSGYNIVVNICSIKNKKSSILENNNQKKAIWLRNMCSNTDYVPFYISWKDGNVVVGKGSEIGDGIFLTWQGHAIKDNDNVQLYISSFSNDDIFWKFLRDFKETDKIVEEVVAVNLALGKPTDQSSSYQTATSSEKAVDGCFGPKFKSGCCTHTNKDYNPWWYVDLGKTYTIKEVVIGRRGDSCCTGRPVGFEVTFEGVNNAGVKFKEVVYRHSTSYVQEVTHIPTPGKTASKVMVSLPNKREYLELCEVQVMQDMDVKLCGKGWHAYDDGDKVLCIFVSKMQLTWKHAVEYCSDHKATLAFPKSPEEQLFMFEQVIGSLSAGEEQSIWLGIHDTKHEGQFETVDGTPIRYADWSKDEPNNNGDEDCVALRGDLSNKTGQWNDFACNRELKFFCREIDLSVTTTTSTTTIPTTTLPVSTTTIPTSTGAVTSEETPKSLKCRQGWSFNKQTEACYKIYIGKHLAFFDAMRMCLQEQSRLTNIETKAEQDFLIELMKREQVVTQSSSWDQLIVAGIEFTKGTWDWYLYDTSWFIGVKWSNGQPDDFRNKEDCAAMRTHPDAVGELNDLPCTYSAVKGHICKQQIDDYQCPSEWYYDQRTKTCYKDFNNKLTWKLASLFCETNGAVLTSIGSPTEQEFINAFKSTPHAYWVGAFYEKDADWFEWIDKTTWWMLLDFDIAPGISSLVGKIKVCGAYANRKLTVNSCEVSNPFICKKKAVDMSVTTVKTLQDGAVTTVSDSSVLGTATILPGTSITTVAGNTSAKPGDETSAVAAETTVAGDELCGQGWERNHETNVCYKINTYPETWEKASLYCKEDAGDLASIVSTSEQQYLLGRLHGRSSLKKSDLWIGANNHDQTSGWRWSDGAPFAYFNWQPLQPDDFYAIDSTTRTRGCGAIVTTKARYFGKWTDPPCEDKKSYICKKVVKQNKVTLVTPIVPLSNEYYGCPGDGWVEYGQSCYLIVQEKQEWKKASEKCKKEGANLASILDENEQNFVFSQLPQDSYCFNIWPNNTQCTTWAERGECDNNPSWMATHCHHACKLCIHNCRDKYFSSSKCTEWALAGECDINPSWMIPNCAQSCGVCVGAPSRGFWIGLQKRAYSRVYQWVDHLAVKYTDWSFQEPIGLSKKGNTCGAMFLQTGKWNDGDCAINLPGYVCKQPKQVLPKTTESPFKEGCTEETSYGYGAFCYTYKQDQKTWEAAQQDCSTNGGSLANIQDIYVQSFVASELANLLNNYWIGLAVRNHSLTWTNLNDVTFTHFDKKFDGTSHFTETCFAMKSYRPVGVWLPYDCDNLLPYICQTQRDGYTTPTTTPQTTNLPSTTLSPCMQPWVEFNNFCYLFTGADDMQPFVQAQGHCAFYGASLASIHSQAENDFLYLQRPENEYYMIGLNDRDVEGVFTWIDGSPFVFSLWNDGEPSNGNGAGEDCSAMKVDKFWNDFKCHFSARFICKIPKAKPIENFGSTQKPDFEDCNGDPEWKVIGNKCYLFSMVKKNWFDAKDNCVERGGNLASLHSAQEKQLLIKLIRERDLVVWIGYTRLGWTARYHWSDGSPVDFVSWDSTQPNSIEVGEKCATMYSSSGLWHDYPCNDLQAYICMKSIHKDTTPQPTTPPAPLNGGCPKDFIGFGYKCYLIVPKAGGVNGYVTWSDAKNACGKRHSELVSIHSELEQAFLTSQVADVTGGLWIGLHDLRDQARFDWIDNSRLVYTNWNEFEPSNSYYNVEECVEMFSSPEQAGLWNDVDCNANRGYICSTYKNVVYTNKQGIFENSSECLVGYTKFGANCYKFNQQRASWEEAKTACTIDNGTLVRPRTLYEQAFIHVLAEDATMEIWTDGKYDTQKGVLWSNGKEPGSTIMYVNDTFQINMCVTSIGDGWGTSSCDTRLPSVCQIPLVESSSATTAVPETMVCEDSTWLLYDGKCYSLNTAPRTFELALTACREQNMNLASIHSLEENIALINYLQANYRYSPDPYIGLRGSSYSGTNVWLDGSPVDYLNFIDEYYIGFSEPVYCTYFMNIDGLWMKDDCSLAHPYICKGDPVILSETSANTPVTSTLKTTMLNTTSTINVRRGSKQFSTSSGSYGGARTKTTYRILLRQHAAQQNQFGDEDKGLSGGEVAGLVIGVCAGFVLVGVIIYTVYSVLVRRKMYGVEKASLGFDNALFHKSNDTVTIDEG